MAEKVGKYVALDTNIWIALVQKVGISAGLEALAEAVEQGDLGLVVPEVVRNELLTPGKDIQSAEGLKKGLIKAGKTLRAGAKDYTPEESDLVGETIDKMNSQLDQWVKEIPARMEIVKRLLDAPSTVTIPTSDSCRLAASKYGEEKKAPFHSGKNSTADALIVLGLSEWAEENSEAEVSFHTFNHSDFSAKGIKQNPHPDLAPLFKKNLSYSFGVENLLTLVTQECELLAEAHRIDFGGPGRCDFCDEPTYIEGASCSECGEYTHDMPDNEDYYLEDCDTGQKVIELVDYSAGRYQADEVPITCPGCGNDTFHIEFASLCSYHGYSWDRD